MSPPTNLFRSAGIPIILSLSAATVVYAGPTSGPSFTLATTGVNAGTWSVPGSDYSITVSSGSSGSAISVAYQGKTFLSTPAGIPIVSTTFGTDTFGPGNGNFKPTLSDSTICNSATLNTVTTTSSSGQYSAPNILSLSGSLSGAASQCNGLSWSINFSVSDPRELKFIASVTGSPNLARTILSFASDSNEEFYGFGEQFSFLNAKGQSIPIVTQENGIGRGNQPITFLLNKLGNGAGGSSVSTYSAVPQYISSHLYAFYLRDFTSFANFDLTQSTQTTIRANQATVSGSLIKQDNYFDLIEAYTGLYSGRQPVVPEWTGTGVVLGLEGGSEKVYPVLQKVVNAGVPVAAAWMQDWSGARQQTIAGTVQDRVWYNWEADKTQYPNWPQFVQNLSSTFNIRSLVYINAFLTDVSNKPSGFKTNYSKQAESLGYLIKNSTNQTYSVSNGFNIGLTDLTNPNAVKWFQDVVRREVFGSGASGYMADFGEYAPFDGVLSSGVDPKVYHNQFPDDWAGLNSQFLTEFPTSLIFHRAWNAKSPSKISILWHGDQLPSYDANDGLKSAILATLGSGFSGIPISHTDVGGYTIVKAYGLPVYTRTEELLSRWMEWAAFTPLYRSHPGSVSTDLQIYDSDNLLNQLKLTSGLFVSLQPYRRKLIQDANQKGYPYIRPSFVQYPNDTQGWAGIPAYQQFFVGDSLLVALALDANVSKVTVRLPSAVSEWVEVWTGTVYNGGKDVSVNAPIGKPVIFVPKVRNDNGLLDGLFAFVKSQQ
ncbi:hypothetical protein HDU76_002984 [Blyttiomyces sp. JEL0837]|nr:hypothetical protein HDU76_002984 [Blyttiomyces sp. JEL0837]